MREPSVCVVPLETYRIHLLWILMYKRKPQNIGKEDRMFGGAFGILFSFWLCEICRDEKLSSTSFHDVREKERVGAATRRSEMVFRAVRRGSLPDEPEFFLHSAYYTYRHPRLVLPLNRVKVDGKSKVKALFWSPCMCVCIHRNSVVLLSWSMQLIVWLLGVNTKL